MRIVIACLLAASAACVTNTAPSDPTPNPGGSGSGSGLPIEPLAGGWSYVEVTPVSNTCGSGIDPAEGAGNFAIDQVGSAGFRVIPNDGSAAFQCALHADNTFACPDRAAGSKDLHPAYDATISYAASADGTFSAATEASGSQDATVHCAGSQCSQLGTFPCTFTVHYVIQATK